LDIPIEDVARIEKGDITITSSLLDQIEAVFDKKKRERLGLSNPVHAGSGASSSQTTPEADGSNNGKVKGAGLRRVKIEGPGTKRKRAPVRGKGQRKEPAKTPGGRVRERRRKARINQKSLAGQLGISVKALSNLEQGDDMDPLTHRQLHAAIRHIEATRPQIIM
jgi:DNA-binding XRE family transcriptional regulator